MSRRVWIEGVMQWRRQKATGAWVEDNPPLPKWAKESSGFVSAERFVSLWSGAESLSELKKEIFWLSLEDIESQAMLLSDWLGDNGYQPLPPKLLWSQAPLSPAAIERLLAAGLLAEAGQADESSPDAAGAAEADETAGADEADEAAEASWPTSPREAEPDARSPNLMPSPARPDEDPDRDYVPFAMRNPGVGVGIGVQKVKKP